VLDANAHAVLGKDDVLGAHLLLGLRLDFEKRFVDLIANKCQPGEEDERDQKGKDLPRGTLVCGPQVFCDMVQVAKRT